MNPFLEKAQRAAEGAERTRPGNWKGDLALEALAWTALYWASENESEKEPMPPPDPLKHSRGRSYEAPTKVLPPEGTRGQPREGWGAGRRFGNFGGEEIES